MTTLDPGKQFWKKKKTCLPASTLRCSSQRAARLPAVFLKLKVEKVLLAFLVLKKAFTCAWSLCNPWQRSCQQWCYPSLVLVALQAPPPPLPGLHYHRRPCVQLSVAGRPGDQADQVGLHSPLMPPADCKPPFLWAVRAEVLRWRTPAGCRIG